MGVVASPRRRISAWSEWTWRSAGTVCTAAESAWPTTCPPHTVPQPRSWLCPRKRFSSIRSRASSFTSSSSTVDMRFLGLETLPPRIVLGRDAGEGRAQRVVGMPEPLGDVEPEIAEAAQEQQVVPRARQSGRRLRGGLSGGRSSRARATIFVRERAILCESPPRLPPGDPPGERPPGWWSRAEARTPERESGRRETRGERRAQRRARVGEQRTWQAPHRV